MPNGQQGIGLTKKQTRASWDMLPVQSRICLKIHACQTGATPSTFLNSQLRSGLKHQNWVLTHKVSQGTPKANNRVLLP